MKNLHSYDDFLNEGMMQNDAMTILDSKLKTIAKGAKKYLPDLGRDEDGTLLVKYMDKNYKTVTGRDFSLTKLKQDPMGCMSMWQTILLAAGWDLYSIEEWFLNGRYAYFAENPTD